MAEGIQGPGEAPDGPHLPPFPDLPRYFSETIGAPECFAAAVRPLWNESGQNGTPNFSALSAEFAQLTPAQLRAVPTTRGLEVLPGVSLEEISMAHISSKAPWNPREGDMPESRWRRWRTARYFGVVTLLSVAVIVTNIDAFEGGVDNSTRKAAARHASNLEQLRICDKDMIMQLYADRAEPHPDTAQIAIDRAAIQTAQKARIPCTVERDDPVIVARYVEGGSGEDTDIVRKQVMNRSDFTEFSFADWTKQRWQLQKEYIAAGDGGDAKEVRRKLVAGNRAYIALKDGAAPTG